MSNTQTNTQPTDREKRTRGSKAASLKPAAPKRDRLEALLRRPKGATMAQLEKTLDWQPHTVRAAISRLRKSGAEVSLDRSGKSPAYRIIATR